MKKTISLAVALLMAVSVWAADGKVAAKHVTVYAEKGRYGGWPANHGIWIWGNEILVGFSRSWFQWNEQDRHPYDREKGEPPALARSLNGGETWSIEQPAELLPPHLGGRQPVELTEPMDFSRPGFAMTIRFGDAHKGPTHLWYTYDRGKSWRGPFQFPTFGQVAIAGRTDYIINGKNEALVFVTAAKPNGVEGRPLCARTTDGGRTWQMLSWVAPFPEKGFTIMPSTVRLSRTELLSTVRHEEVFRRGPNAIDAYLSKDNGATWEFLSRPVADTGVKSGNPPSLVRMKDGRLVITYGFRTQPYSIRAVFSSDNGRTWSQPITLREGAEAWDVGYTRAVQRPDGKIVTVYYWSPGAKTERTIEATIWQPAR